MGVSGQGCQRSGKSGKSGKSQGIFFGQGNEGSEGKVREFFRKVKNFPATPITSITHSFSTGCLLLRVRFSNGPPEVGQHEKNRFSVIISKSPFDCELNDVHE